MSTGLTVLLLLSATAHAGPPVFYTSALGDGSPSPFPPPPIPASGRLDLWLETGTSQTPVGGSQEICVDGQGDEICAWQVEFEATGGVAIVGFEDAIENSGNPVDFTRPTSQLLRINRLDAVPPDAGDFGRMRVGTMILNVTSSGDVLLTASSVAIDASLDEIPVVPVVIASPEPGATLGVMLSVLVLAMLATGRKHRNKIDSGIGSGALLLMGLGLAVLIFPADARAGLCGSAVPPDDVNNGVRVYRPAGPAPPVVVDTVLGYGCVPHPLNGAPTAHGSQIRFTSTHLIGVLSTSVLFHDLSLPFDATATVTLSDGLGNFDSITLPNSPVAVGALTIDSPGTTQVTLSSSRPVFVPSSPSIGLRPHCGDAYTDLSDPDEDGLPTAWEVCGLKLIETPSPLTNGVKVCGLEPCDLDLQAMGADPMKKDVFVELDWMARGPHSRGHWPRKWAVRRMINAFLDAPVENPNPQNPDPLTMGIRLHIDAGPWSVMNPDTGERWGSLSRSTALPHQDRLGNCPNLAECSPAVEQTIWDEFDAIKNGQAGAAGHFAEVRRPVFRYGLLAHRVDGPAVGYGPGHHLGVTRNFGSADFIAALGDLHLSGGGTPLQQGGAIMHELGHAMNLSHGGGDGYNLKPNNLSIMNYSFAHVGLMRTSGNNPFDYSRWSLPTLNETALNEDVGIHGGSEEHKNALTSYGTRWACPDGLCSATGDRCWDAAQCSGGGFCGYGHCSGGGNLICETSVDCPGAAFCIQGECALSGSPCESDVQCTIASDYCKPLPPDQRKAKPAIGPIDWDCDGSTDEVTNVLSDVNADGSLDPLSGNQNEWLSLQYQADNVGSLSHVPSSTPGGNSGDMPQEIAALIRNERNVQVAAALDSGLRPGSSRQLSFSLRNTGRVPDTYSLQLLSDQGWATAALPSTVALDVDQEFDVVVTIEIPPGSPIGLIDEVGIEAVSDSDGSVVYSDTTIVDVFSCGDVTRDAIVDAEDVIRLRAALLSPNSAPLSEEGLRRCSVSAPDLSCDLKDLVVLARAAAVPAAAPGVSQTCEAALP